MADFDPLVFIESMNTLTDSMESMRTSLLSKGWGEAAAEQATISVFTVMLAKS